MAEYIWKILDGLYVARTQKVKRSQNKEKKELVDGG